MQAVPGEVQAQKAADSNGAAKSASQSSDDALDALKSFASAAALAAKQAEAGQPDSRVWVAFALGWQMAELYRPDRRRKATSASADDLPGLGRLTVDEWTRLGLDQVQAGIAKLRSAIDAAGLDVPDAEAFEATVPSIVDLGQRQQKIREFHVDVLATLTATDFRLGKAYGLGRALADTTRDPNDFREEFKEGRIQNLTEWILDLATAFPPHAAHAVASSLKAWREWVASPQNSAANQGDVLPMLRSQGRTWRSLLSGEKLATSVLATGDYVKAGEGLIERSKSLAGQFLHHYWWLATIIVVLFAGGIAVIFLVGDTKAIAAGVATILASLGLTWRGVGATLGTAAVRLEEPIWGAELDAVICRRITAAPVPVPQPAAK